jgi:hypothetical protein
MIVVVRHNSRPLVTKDLLDSNSWLELLLKNTSRSDRVAEVDFHIGLLGPFLARLANAVTLRRFIYAVVPRTKPVSYKSLLAPDDILVLNEILDELDQQGLERPPNINEIIEIALRRLQWDLDSGREDEIIEDLEREIDYRQWCARFSENKCVTVRVK